VSFFVHDFHWCELKERDLHGKENGFDDNSNTRLSHASRAMLRNGPVSREVF
jgi:hypothetical protein